MIMMKDLTLKLNDNLSLRCIIEKEQSEGPRRSNVVAAEKQVAQESFLK